ncbi:MAG: hypothetical protein HKP38_12125 [Croceitalea sp.]|nr:hypothetical protein [Croceitalea sp.]MBT8238101.1 hypothetical protein [Croceitalea sp.]NNC34305.1 hypothetical protein [Croceitalea sp.]NNL09962.1 hypothetical protein [Croceitalea sp.]
MEQRKSKLAFWLLILVILLSVLLLISGSPILDKSLLENRELPFGNLTTAIGFLAIPLAIMNRVIANKNFPKGIRKLYVAALILASILALFWWFYGRLLSGNWSNNFINAPKASEQFWNYTYGILLFPLSILFIYLTHVLIIKFKSK